MEVFRAYSTFVHGAANIQDLALPALPRDRLGLAFPGCDGWALLPREPS